MHKKSTEKKIRFQSSKRKKNILYFGFRYLLSFIAIYMLVSILSPLVTKTSVQCANSISCAESLKLKIENNAVGVFENQKVIPPTISLSENNATSTVLGSQTATGEKHIYVDLNLQLSLAYEGKTLIMQTPISSGKWHPTPTGDFTIWIKIRSTRMSGGSGADYYNLPNVPYVMFFANNEIPKGAGFSFHGAYWHDNFGHPMSHGCINMRITDAEKLYNWANLATVVTIYGDAPL